MCPNPPVAVTSNFFDIAWNMSMSVYPYVSEVYGSPTVPVASVLSCTSRELRTLAGMTNQVQSLISQLVLEATARDATTLRGLQSLDQIAQTIHGIASFLEALAAGAPTDCRLDVVAASRSVNVADLASRLGFAIPPRAITPQAPDGECHFFDGEV
jgi:hypothetical protein